MKTTGKDSGTLALSTAVLLGTTLAGYEGAVLLLRAHSEINAIWPNVTADQLICGLAYGDATIAQIAAVFTSATANPENAQDYRESQTSTRAVIDFVALQPARENGDTMSQSIEWRLPKGGLPAGKGNGFQTFLFNPSATANLVNGPTIIESFKAILGPLK